MDPTAAVKGEMRFFRKKNQPGGGPSGGSPPDREIPRPPHAPLPPFPARRGADVAGRFCACDAGGRFHDGSKRGRRGAECAFPGNSSMRSTGRTKEASSARAGRGASMRLHAGFMMDPAPARVRKTHFPPFRMQNPQGFAGLLPPGREIPHAPQTRPPRLPNHRGRSGRAGGRRVRRIRWKAREADAANAMGGCSCACGARVAHAICKRYRSYIPTQPI